MQIDCDTTEPRWILTLKDEETIVIQNNDKPGSAFRIMRDPDGFDLTLWHNGGWNGPRVLTKDGQFYSGVPDIPIPHPSPTTDKASLTEGVQ